MYKYMRCDMVKILNHRRENQKKKIYQKPLTPHANINSLSRTADSSKLYIKKKIAASNGQP